VPVPATLITIGGGVADSTAFRWSSALSEIVSRPPGLPDCDPTAPCGVPGVIASAQTFDNSTALLKALADGRIVTAVIPALPVYRARCQVGARPQAAITVLKSLYRQPLYIVTQDGQPAIGRPGDWAGKTIATGPAGSDSDSLAGALLDAYRLARAKVKLLRLPPDQALAAVKAGTAVAGIFIGRIFDAPVGDLLRHGFTLMSLPESPERDRFLKAVPVLEANAIQPGTFPGLPPISTVGQSVSWVAGPALDPAIAGSLVASISDPRNLVRLDELVDPVPGVPASEAFLHLPAPLAEGANRFALSRKLPVETLDCPASPR